MYPGLFLLEYPGYWEDEPDNGHTIFVNPTQITHLTPFKRENRKVVLWRMHISDQEVPFIISADQIQPIDNPNIEGEVH
jgi:hypothetical protein